MLPYQAGYLLEATLCSTTHAARQPSDLARTCGRSPVRPSGDNAGNGFCAGRQTAAPRARLHSKSSLALDVGYRVSGATSSPSSDSSLGGAQASAARAAAQKSMKTGGGSGET